ncbi:urease accessory protein UreF [Paenibacillus abyssi]|uniref:Urease accessory protein UreF n=1 Tax=Paenibacillus abyssi TaxID=1340531 RepID=A0A917LFY2_9BACL|nr:urease accessory UreF family protein [Paenibacillus abyssi]GGG19664.1 urease accessory protein UreF [Paenibacillus abyssi]
MKDYGSWLAMQQLLDSALPIGGFSHSFGLETLVQEGQITTSKQLLAFADTMLKQSWAPGDAMVIKAVYRDAESGQWDRVWAVEKQVHMQRISSETRSGMEKMGKRLLQLAAAMHPQLDLSALKDAVQSGKSAATHPLVYSVICYRLGAPIEQAVQGYLYSCIVTCINSALRLISMGQTEGQAIIAKLIPEAMMAWRLIEALEPEDAWTNMPLAELGMIRHETLYSRLFMS